MENQAHITVRRGETYADGGRKYEIVIDGAPIGSLRPGSVVAFDLAPGTHTIRLRIDWCGSPALSFDAQSGEQIAFECGSSWLVGVFS